MMTVPARVLVVSAQEERREELAAWLRCAGYRADQASTFAAARLAWNDASPDLLITDVKLQAYNGLHLAIWSRSRHATVPVLLLGDADRVLQQDAEREAVAYLVRPFDREKFLEAVAALQFARWRARRSVRQPVTLAAEIEGVSVSLRDWSPEGACIAMHDAELRSFPAYFTLHIPTWGVACRLQRVWTARPRTERRTVVCGACVAGVDTPGAVAWRSLVHLLTIPATAAADLAESS